MPMIPGDYLLMHRTEFWSMAACLIAMGLTAGYILAMVRLRHDRMTAEREVTS